MDDKHDSGARAVIAKTLASLCLVYAVALTVGLLTLPSPSHPIRNPWFTMMEVLILAIAPAMVALSAVLHARASSGRKAFGVCAVAFMSMCAAVTCCVRFSILVLSREPAFVAQPWVEQVFSFRWPSVAYALDILAWDIFFPLAALCAAVTIEGTGLLRAARSLMYLSAGLSFAGLLGIPLGNMNVRNIGVVGYAGVFPLAVALLAKAYRRAGT